MKTLLSATFLLIACNAVRAGGPDAAAVKNALAADTKAKLTAAYTPKTKSVFTATAVEHNPFWPIGWVKIESANADGSGNQTMPRPEDFAVTTILLNDPPMAVINGKDMAEGEVASMPINGQNIAVQLMAVQDGRVILRWQNQSIIVPIHRNEDLTAVAP